MERADLGIGTTEQHMCFILYVIGITDITDRRNTIGLNSLFNLKSVYPLSESGSVVKNVMEKIQEARTIDDMLAIYCCLLWDQGLSECARPSSTDKRCDIQQESVLEPRLMSPWSTCWRKKLPPERTAMDPSSVSLKLCSFFPGYTDPRESDFPGGP
eukprot:1136809-Pelagomonas_calceolata.AAC.11